MLYKNQNYCPRDSQNYVNDYLESENFYCVNQKDLKMRKQFAWVFNYPNYPGGFMSQLQFWSFERSLKGKMSDNTKKELKKYKITDAI